uniref:Putative bacteriophage protein n=1 Tax=Ralstonia solanacearum TaxID=305 RepID=A0A0S4WPL4_RALSL|nr:putative bacteriophage protein [Ralstonia solanacearum]
MRDVTDNVTGDLLGAEQRRGRGRPRKAHAMTNAERQAAYRARRKVGQAADRSVTVTKKPVEVDAYDACRLEVDQLRAELVGLRRQVGLAEAERTNAFHLAGLKSGQLQEVLRELEMTQERVGALCAELQALKAQQPKSVTPSNGNPVSFDAMLDLLALAAKANTFEQRQKVRESELWADSFVRTQAVSEAQMQAAGEALYGDRKVVTRKA